MLRRPPSIRLRACVHDARTPLRHAAPRRCPHTSGGRRVKPLRRRRSSAAGHRTVAPVLVGLGGRPPVRPRRIMDIHRRPSEPPRCHHVAAPSALARLVAHAGGFGLLCIGAYFFMVGSMVAAALLH